MISCQHGPKSGGMCPAPCYMPKRIRAILVGVQPGKVTVYLIKGPVSVNTIDFLLYIPKIFVFKDEAGVYCHLNFPSRWCLRRWHFGQSEDVVVKCIHEFLLHNGCDVSWQTDSHGSLKAFHLLCAAAILVLTRSLCVLYWCEAALSDWKSLLRIPVQVWESQWLTARSGSVGLTGSWSRINQIPDVSWC